MFFFKNYVKFLIGWRDQSNIGYFCHCQKSSIVHGACILLVFAWHACLSYKTDPVYTMTQDFVNVSFITLNGSAHQLDLFFCSGYQVFDYFLVRCDCFFGLVSMNCIFFMKYNVETEM